MSVQTMMRMLLTLVCLALPTTVLTACPKAEDLPVPTPSTTQPQDPTFDPTSDPEGTPRPSPVALPTKRLPVASPTSSLLDGGKVHVRFDDVWTAPGCAPAVSPASLGNVAVLHTQGSEWSLHFASQDRLDGVIDKPTSTLLHTDAAQRDGVEVVYTHSFVGTLDEQSFTGEWTYEDCAFENVDDTGRCEEVKCEASAWFRMSLLE